MIHLVRKIAHDSEADSTLTLPLESRVKSRFRSVLDDGREVGLFLERGQVLQDGDLLASEDGLIVRIIAAQELLSTVSSNDALLIARACYHLGNRHVALQIKVGRLQYLHDHVLDSMVEGLGLKVETEVAPFEPEAGAYGEHRGGGGHQH